MFEGATTFGVHKGNYWIYKWKYAFGGNSISFITGRSNQFKSFTIYLHFIYIIALKNSFNKLSSKMAQFLFAII